MGDERPGPEPAAGAVWRTQDRLGREVVLNEVRLAHILDEHPELTNRLVDVRAAVEAPDFVNRDVRHAHRENHYRRRDSDTSWLKVVVHYRPISPQGTWAGEVITAYPNDLVDKKETRLWP
jgi:hypothetical protein